jgi:hypothetical protein
MGVGLAGATLAQKWLDMLAGTAFTAPASSNVNVHTADPGAAGTTSMCTGTNSGDRKALTWSAASTSTNTTTKNAVATFPSWASWDMTGAPNTVTHVSAWDAAGSGAGAGTADTGGNFLFSGQLTASKSVSTGDTFNLTSLAVSLTPIAV